MISETDVGRDVLVRERELAIKQALVQVLIQGALLAGCVSIWVWSGFARQLGWVIAVGTTAAAATVYDLRWWMWLRGAAPSEAFGALQQREDFEGWARRTHVSLFATPVVLALWWCLAK